MKLCDRPALLAGVSRAEAGQTRFMPTGRNHGLLIAGGGVSGSLAALAMARLRPEVPLLLVSEEASFGGGRSLLLFDDDLDEAGRDFVAPLIEESWDGYYVAFPGAS